MKTSEHLELLENGMEELRAKIVSIKTQLGEAQRPSILPRKQGRNILNVNPKFLVQENQVPPSEH